jgi:dCTP diphosphatase
MSQVTVEALAKRVKDFVEKRSWTKYHKPKDIAIALSVEAAELLEIFQWSGGAEGLGEDGGAEGLGEEDLRRVRMETADTVIYALSMANACGFDLGEAVIEKISLNEKKYPVDKSRNMFDR